MWKPWHEEIWCFVQGHIRLEVEAELELRPLNFQFVRDLSLTN